MHCSSEGLCSRSLGLDVSFFPRSFLASVLTTRLQDFCPLAFHNQYCISISLRNCRYYSTFIRSFYIRNPQHLLHCTKPNRYYSTSLCTQSSPPTLNSTSTISTTNPRHKLAQCQQTTTAASAPATTPCVSYSTSSKACTPRTAPSAAGRCGDPSRALLVETKNRRYRFSTRCLCCRKAKR